ncbi:MAG TPA: pseudouridine synthase [Treponemataceae bacterium]|nr:pseudouridine synthase [Treponemataceae bacterium]
MMRLDTLLAHAGLGTRKAVKKYIRSGVVFVNDVVCKVADTHVNEKTDTITVENRVVVFCAQTYLMVNKPPNTVCAAKDALHQTVFSMLNERHYNLFLAGKLHIVGRLDRDTEGLLLLTTDGQWTHKITAPKNNISKTYYVELRDAVKATEYIDTCFACLQVPPEGSEAGFSAKPAHVEWVSATSCYLTIYEGKYHQVKRMFAVVKNKVVFLKRVGIGSLRLDSSLALGEYRELTQDELERVVAKSDFSY